jgi:thiamine-phosphate pyrophosphorylase
MTTLDPTALRLYVVTATDRLTGPGHLGVVEAAITGGATAIQLRAPELADEDLLPLARAVASRCRAAGVLSIVNDRPGVARAAGADGAHVGQGDDPGAARDVLGPEAILGISVEDPTQARAAEAAGADYLGVTVWATPTKPDAEPRGLGGLHEVCDAVGLPVVGIGGIDATNARAVLDAGAAGVAVISAVAGAADPVGATRRLRSAVERGGRA